ncbi:hypothetical protein B0H13DRAFT_2482182 [Mycena leptocephala]|nr:hypothetical protein B0H13DRAFT_2482182 [Mycena leptocephala]
MSSLSGMLPPELERLIFETAAFLHPEAMSALLRVARRVKIWIEPLIYRALLISSSKESHRHHWSAVHSTMQTTRSRFLLREHVRHLYFTDAIWMGFLTEFLTLCDGTTHLAFSSATTQPGLLQILAALPLQRISCFLHILFSPSGPVNFSHSLFERITHLDAFDWAYKDWDSWSGLEQMPQLTHLSFRHHIRSSICERALKSCRRLQVLVIVWLPQSDLHAIRANIKPPRFTEEALIQDPRFVMVHIQDFVLDWERSARGGSDYWFAAESLVHRRRVGETKDYFIDLA